MAEKTDWRHHLEKWQQSGLSQAEYCRRNALSAGAFQWHKSQQKKKGSSFVPVMVNGSWPGITIGIGDLIRVEILQPVKAEKVANIIKALELVK